MSTSGQFTGFALGALTASLAILVFAGPPNQDSNCPMRSAGGASGRGNVACSDMLPVERLVPMAGDRTVVPTDDGRGIQIALQGSSARMLMSSIAGSSIDRINTVARRPAEPQSDQTLGERTNNSVRDGSQGWDDWAVEPDAGIGDIGSLPDIIRPVRANRRELPVFEEGRAPDPVSTSPGQAWDSDSRRVTDIESREVADDESPDSGNQQEVGDAARMMNTQPSAATDPSSPRSSSTVETASSVPENRDHSPEAPSLLTEDEAAGNRRAGAFAEGVGSQTAPERMESAGSRFAFSRGGDIDRREVAALPELAADRAVDSVEEPDSPQEADPDLEAGGDPEAVGDSETVLDDVGDVRLRAGEHDGFSRLVFDWPREIDYSIDTSSGQARIVFPVTARVDSDAARRQTLSRIRGFDVEQTDDGLVLTIDMAASMSVRAFRLDNRVVVDVEPS